MVDYVRDCNSFNSWNVLANMYRCRDVAGRRPAGRSRHLRGTTSPMS